SCGSPLARGFGAGSRWKLLMSSELQSALAGGVGHGGDAAVVQVPAAVEDHGGHTGGPGPLGDELADLGGRLLVAGGAAGQVLLVGRRRGEGDPGAVVDDLDADVLVRTEDGQARPLGRALHLLADATV